MEKDKDDRPIDAAWVRSDASARSRKTRSPGKAPGWSRRHRSSRIKPRNLDGSTLDDDDRDAARALRGKKKKEKKEARGTASRAEVGEGDGSRFSRSSLIIGGAYLALRPASPEKLAAAIESASTPEAKLEAATKYLEKYGERPGEVTDKAAAAFREGKIRERERQLANSFTTEWSKPDRDAMTPTAYTAAWEAMEVEKSGQPGPARSAWRSGEGAVPGGSETSVRLEDRTTREGPMGLGRGQTTRGLKTVRNELAALRKDIEENRRHDLPFTVEPGSPKGMAIRGLRLEEFGDKERPHKSGTSSPTTPRRNPNERDLVSSRLPAARAHDGWETIRTIPSAFEPIGSRRS